MFNWKSETVNNALIQLGETIDVQKGRPFKSRFIQAGIAGYPKQFGNVLITKETLDGFVQTLVNKPVIINHKDEIKEEDKVGKVENVWFNAEDGWFWCSGYLTDETAINLIKDKHWSVSCSYDVLLLDDEGGTENNIKYDKEFLNGVFTHLAIVENPRYERANIVVNSKTEILNKGIETMEIDNDKWITVHPNGDDEKGRHLLIQDGEDVKEAMQRQWGVYDKRQAKLKSDDKPKVEKDEKKKEKTSKIYDNLLNDSGLIKHLKESIKAQKAENPNAQVGDTVIDSDRYISLYTDKLTTEEFKNFNADKAEDLIFKKLNEMEKEAGFKETKQEPKQEGKKDKFRYEGKTKIKQITKDEWDKTPNDYKMTKDGKKYIMYIDDETHSTVLGRAEIIGEEKATKSEGRFFTKDRLKEDNPKQETKQASKTQVIEKAEKSLSSNKFIPKAQKSILKKDLKGEEYEHFADKIEEIADKIKNAPNMYETDGVKLADKKPILHFFGGNYDSYVYEIDKKTGEMFGAVSFYGGEDFELGYLSMDEINTVPNIELDLYFDGEQPKALKNKANNNKEQEMTLIAKLKKLIKEVQNSKGEKMSTKDRILNILNEKEVDEDVIEEVENEFDEIEEKEKEIKNKKAKNEKVDKRKLIDEVAGMMKSAGCSDEIIRTAIKDMEKEAYDKSEDDGADNKKAKNEDEEKDEKEVKKVEKEVKEDVDNKCKNSVYNATDYFNKVNEIYNSSCQAGIQNKYETQADRLEAGKKY